MLITQILLGNYEGAAATSVNAQPGGQSRKLPSQEITIL